MMLYRYSLMAIIGTMFLGLFACGEADPIDEAADLCLSGQGDYTDSYCKTASLFCECIDFETQTRDNEEMDVCVSYEAHNCEEPLTCCNSKLAFRPMCTTAYDCE